MDVVAESTVQVLVACDAPEAPTIDAIRQWVAATLEAASAEAAGDVSVKIVDAEEMRALNRNYRDMDKPTNVLSFPAAPVAGLPAEEAGLLGDVAICAEVVNDEARKQQKTPAAHWGHMLVHGTLHLLGYDHLNADDAAAMEALETKILEAGGVADPYRDR